MGGVYTDVEKTLIELERNLVVKDTRNTRHEGRVHRRGRTPPGRRVHAFISDSHVGLMLGELDLDLLVQIALDALMSATT